MTAVLAAWCLVALLVLIAYVYGYRAGRAASLRHASPSPAPNWLDDGPCTCGFCTSAAPW